MAEPRFTMTADDDLPRTFRREKEAREREAREREGTVFQTAPVDDTADYDYGTDDRYETEGMAVSRLDIPFFHLMFFFIKAVFAAIPAIILLVGVCILIGEVLQSQLPWLRQFEFELIMRPPR